MVGLGRDHVRAPFPFPTAKASRSLVVLSESPSGFEERAKLEGTSVSSVLGRDRNGRLIVVETPGKTRVTLLDPESLRSRGHAVLPKLGSYERATLSPTSDVFALRRLERVDRAYVVRWDDDAGMPVPELRVADAKVTPE